MGAALFDRHPPHFQSALHNSLSDRRGEVLKFSYNLRDWWQVGVAALVDDKGGADHSFDIMPLSLRNGESLGVQIDAQFKF